MPRERGPAALGRWLGECQNRNDRRYGFFKSCWCVQWLGLRQTFKESDDAAAQARFGLSAAAIAVEKPGGVPFGWKALEPGGVDAWLGGHGLTWLGPMFPELDLFGPAGEEVKSVALIRMALHLGGERGEEARPALAAFGSPEPEGFTAGMGCELVAFVAAVVARTAERWPVLS